MKFSFLGLLLAFCLFPSISSAQTFFKYEISLKNTNISTAAKKTRANIKITNLLSSPIDTAAFENIRFYLAICGQVFYCGYEGDVFSARAEIKSKTLKQNESANFNINLADLSWKDPLSSFFVPSKNFSTVRPANYFFYAEMGGVLSNQLSVRVDPK